MILGISMRIAPDPGSGEVRDALSHDWVRFLEDLGVVPVPIPNALSDPFAFLRAVGARGVVLTGGEDLGPLPGEAGGGIASSARDTTERAVVLAALQAGLPLLGVCRGFQMVNMCLGGSLTRDLETACEGQEKHRRGEHEVALVEARERALAGRDHIMTNTYHRQGVMVGDLAWGLRPFAITSAGVVEGYRHRALPVLGLQWHPERANPAAAVDRALLREWLSEC